MAQIRTIIIDDETPAREMLKLYLQDYQNIDEVAKIELYEKDSYRVHLKNKTVLIASSSGYKMLKNFVK